MRLRTILAAVAATSLTLAPVMAEAATAPRNSADLKGEELRGGFIIPILALIAVILGILALTSDDNESLPHSP